MVRDYSFFQCHRCGQMQPDYLIFATSRGNYYCLSHIPWLPRLRVYLRERFTTW
jgi:hypothetical protein